MWWLFTRLVRRPLRRILLGSIGVAFPVAMLGAMLLFVDVAVQSMTAVALQDVQVEMRALASSLTVDMAAADAQIATVPGVRRVDRFASADVVVSADGAAPTPARLFAVDPVYAQDHPEVKVTSGALEAGALLAEPLRALPGFASATTISIALPAAPPPPPPPPSPTPPTDEEAAPEPPPPPPWSMTMPVGGTADLRQASTWYAVPSGEAQGDVALVPRALIMDYNSFESTVLPALRNAAAGDASWAFNPGATDLPQASVEAHVTIDHAAYPVDPAEAIAWSNKIRRVMERQAAGALIVTDDAAEALTSAKEDATNAKILFLLLGVPGVLVGAGLGLAAAGALAESQRREQALLQLRGATSGQLLALTTAEAVLTGIIGAALGLVAAAAAVGAVTGQPVWEQVPVERLRVSAAIAVAAGILTTATRMVRVLRSSRRHAEVASERSRLESGWDPGWKRARLDLVALGVGVLILGVNVFAGGLKQTPIEGQTLALAFYVLLAPIALWLGATLLIVRGVFALLTRRARAGRANGLRSWPGTAVRWLGRRPARTAAALVLTALAVAFGTTVAAFTDTYRVARTNDQVSALGSDLRLTPPVDAPGAPPPITGVAATSPVWEVPARVGNDRKTISALDVASYRQAATAPAHMLSGEAVAALDGDPAAVLINKELADGFSVGPGDFLPVTIFPDDPSRVLILNLRVVGVFRSVAPMEPFAELFMPTSSFPAPLPPPDFYLARVAPGSSTAAVAEEARRQLPTYTVTTLRTLRISQERALTALNVRTLGRLQIVAAGLVAAVGVAVLGAFLVLERRRESIILRTVGASTGQVVTAPVVEGAIAALGGLAIGIPVGLFLGALNIQILALFFTLPPPLLVVSGREVAALAAVVVLASVLALAVALTRVAHQSAASVLRDV